MSFAGNTPPSKQVPSGPLTTIRNWFQFIYFFNGIRIRTYAMRASHSKKLSSLIGPATIPSGGFNVSSTKNGNKKFKIQPIAHTDNVASRMI